MKKTLMVVIAILGISIANAALPTEAQTFPFVVKTDGTAVKIYEIVKVEADGKMTYKRNKKVMSKMKKKEYKYIWTPMPKDLKSAASAADYAKAYTKYKNLGWDVYCTLKEAELIAKTDKVKALARIKTIENYEMINPIKKTDIALANKLLATLYIENGKIDEANKVLIEVAKAEDNKTAAFALNKQGDILLQTGKTKDAIIAYLQTVILFPKELAAERAEALCKAHNAMKAMNDGGRATTFSKQLIKEYPESQYINKLTK